MLPDTSRQRPSGTDAKVPAPSFMVVVGMYNMRLEESIAVKTLQAAEVELTPDLGRVNVLFYDNGPRDGETSHHDVSKTLPHNYKYERANYNGGLARAFNRAVSAAIANGNEWLITLDQDTALPGNYLRIVCEIIKEIGGDPSIAAIAPRITEGGRVLSPNWFWGGAIPIYYPSGFVGIGKNSTYAFNSGSVLRVAALRQVGGYHPRFPLDYSDAVLYHRLNRYGKRIFVAGDLQLEHQFSLNDRKTRMSTSRYGDLLRAETAFWDLAMNRFAAAERTVRLIGRWCVDRRRGRAMFCRQTMKALEDRLLRSRASRIAAWTQDMPAMQSSLQGSAVGTDSERRPRISVCMATANGEKYILEQLSSILPQLANGDEVIVVDDASLDQTKEKIRALNDVRIRLIEHTARKGIAKTFEHAVRAASGNFLFLSDQDDVWSPFKVSTVMDIFRRRGDVTLVVSNVEVINENGKWIDHRTYSKPGRFSSAVFANIIRNRFQGATMAFRATLIPEILPFPTRCGLLHDAWIGIRNTMIGGISVNIDRPLLKYRRHSHNVTRPLGLGGKILKRLYLMTILCMKWMHDQWVGPGRRLLDADIGYNKDRNYQLSDTAVRVIPMER